MRRAQARFSAPRSCRHRAHEQRLCPGIILTMNVVSARHILTQTVAAMGRLSAGQHSGRGTPSIDGAALGWVRLGVMWARASCSSSPTCRHGWTAVLMTGATPHDWPPRSRPTARQGVKHGLHHHRASHLVRTLGAVKGKPLRRPDRRRRLLLQPRQRLTWRDKTTEAHPRRPTLEVGFSRCRASYYGSNPGS